MKLIRDIIPPDPCQFGLVLDPVKAWPGEGAARGTVAQRPALTASRHEANSKSWVGTKKRAFQVEQRNWPLLPVSLFDPRPFLRPDLPPPGRRAQTPSRLAVAQKPQRALRLPGHALYGDEHGVTLAAAGPRKVLLKPVRTVPRFNGCYADLPAFSGPLSAVLAIEGKYLFAARTQEDNGSGTFAMTE